MNDDESRMKLANVFLAWVFQPDVGHWMPGV